MATLALGSGIGRVIGIVAIPVLTRIYTPEDFGVLAVFTALVAILAPLVTLRYVLALPLPRQDGVAMNLLALSTGLMLGLSALIALSLWMGGETLLGLVSMQVLAPWWWLIALGVLGTATYEMLTLWATRRRAYKVIAQTNVTQSLAGTVVKIGLGVLSVQPLGLLLGQVVAQAGGVGRLLRGFLGEFRANWHHISPARLRKVAWKHRGFAIWRVPSQFLMVFSMQAPMFFMAALYDAQTTGQFGLAMMALSMPVAILGQSAGKALYGEASQIFKEEPARVVKMAGEVQVRLLAVALVPAALLFFFGSDLFYFAFGPEWRLAGQFTSLISFAIVFQFSSAPLIQLMNLLKNQSVFLLINILRSAGLAIVFMAGAWLELDAMTVVAWYSAFTTIFYLGISAFIMYEFYRLKARRMAI
ncbi:lipopolysaccharide biosynthesis protein [Pseudotabrizicola alkalilacus]|nr:oligosaccharide flippase family protein [Pseudotabrizicola alkalilacus]